MNHRRRHGLLLAVLSLVVGTMVSAGGWAVVTVDTLPEYVHVGEPFALAYAVRQHGVRLVSGLHGHVEARAGTVQIVADARPATEGHYVATLTIPTSGEWSLTIRSGFGGHGTITLLPLSVVERTAPAAAIRPSDKGRRLFVAKGCATCHRVEGQALPASGMYGPPLVPHKFQSEYLARILANPALLPPAANYPFRMPNLGLDPRETEALVAFINDRSSDANTGAHRP
jgi:hypothetical protein